MAAKISLQWRHLGGPEKFWVVAGILFLIVDLVVFIMKVIHENYLAAAWMFLLGLLVVASIAKWFTTDLHPSIRNRES